MVMAMLFVVTTMFVSQINVCMHRFMFAKKEDFGKVMMQCNSDRQKHEVGRVKNVICGVCKCCCFLSSFTIRLSITFLFNLKGFL
jgi:hypothetical protein